MSGPNPKLIADLAKLAAKYRAKDWEQLSAWLDDEPSREKLRALLADMAVASRSRKATKRKARKPSRAVRLRASLTDIRGEDAERADLLEDIWLKLRQRELLPTIAAVRTFAQTFGFKDLKSSRRDQAVTELMELLVNTPIETLEEKMRQTVVVDRQLGEEYERWVRLILRRP